MCSMYGYSIFAYVWPLRVMGLCRVDIPCMEHLGVISNVDPGLINPMVV